MQEEATTAIKLGQLRVQIDAIDGEVMRLLGERGKLVHQVGELKPEVHSVRVPAREQQVLAHAERLALEYGLDGEFGRDLYQFLLNYFATREENQVRLRVTAVSE